jgi:glycosyltransferase involved in cell wall biosynthesis
MHSIQRIRIVTTSQSQTTPPALSVIIPVRNGGAYLETCLRAVFRSSFKQFEVIVVDDHSTDSSPEIARRFPCTIVTLEGKGGANAARNFGATAASGQVLVFLDADVRISRDSLTLIAEIILEREADAVVGLYTARHRHESFVSQYKNLWVRYSYLKSPPAIDWLFGAISGIRRDAFEAVGGFNESLMARHGNDDIELGKRMALSNLRIYLSQDLEVEHLKNYTLGSFIRNEYERSRGFARLAARLGETGRAVSSGFANVYPAFILSTPLTVAILLLTILVALDLAEISWLAGAAVLYLGMNLRFLNYLEQVRGLFAMIAMIPILFLDHLTCFVGSCVGLLGAKSAEG